MLLDSLVVLLVRVMVVAFRISIDELHLSFVRLDFIVEQREVTVTSRRYFCICESVYFRRLINLNSKCSKTSETRRGKRHELTNLSDL